MSTTKKTTAKKSANKQEPKGKPNPAVEHPDSRYEPRIREYVNDEGQMVDVIPRGRRFTLEMIDNNAYITKYDFKLHDLKKIAKANGISITKKNSQGNYVYKNGIELRKELRLNGFV